MEACQKRGVATPTWSINGDFVVVTFMRPTNGGTQSDTQDDAQSYTQYGTQYGTQDVIQDVTQGVTQDVPQDVPQDNELDDWIEKQIRNNSQISTEDLAKLSNRSSKTIKRHLAKMSHIRYVGSGYSGHWEIVE
jgi:ATP-dependent DNA helicase RecG